MVVSPRAQHHGEAIFGHGPGIMSGELQLDRLLTGMAPELDPVQYVFATFADGQPPGRIRPIGTFAEKEGLTAIITLADAQACGIAASSSFRRITLTIHSALEAVGFLAAITRALADAGIACNAVSAFHHDHVFVPASDAEHAMVVLRALSGERHPADRPGR